MSMIVARMQKMKADNLIGIGNHNQRKTKNHSNPDIDTSLSELNYDLVNRGSPSEGTTRGKLNHIHQYSQYFEDIFLENKVKQRIKSIYLYILKYLLRLFAKK